MLPGDGVGTGGSRRAMAWVGVVDMCNLYSGMPSANYEGETRSIRLGGHSTSIRIEVMFWGVLEDIAASQGMTLPRLVTVLYDEVLALHGEARNFASLLRCACLRHLEMKAAEVASARRLGSCGIAGERRPTPVMEPRRLG